MKAFLRNRFAALIFVSLWRLEARVAMSPVSRTALTPNLAAYRKISPDKGFDLNGVLIKSMAASGGYSVCRKRNYRKRSAI